MPEDKREYYVRLKISVQTPYRNHAIDRILGVLGAADIEADVADDSEYETPEQERQKNPASWFFLSFANDEQCLGGAFVRAHGPRTAIQRARDLGIQFADATVQCQPLPEDEFLARVPGGMRERLLTEEEVREVGGE
jgi:hypothetical protein